MLPPSPLSYEHGQARLAGRKASARGFAAAHRLPPHPLPLSGSSSSGSRVPPPDLAQQTIGFSVEDSICMPTVIRSQNAPAVLDPFVLVNFILACIFSYNFRSYRSAARHRP